MNTDISNMLTQYDFLSFKHGLYARGRDGMTEFIPTVLDAFDECEANKAEFLEYRENINGSGGCDGTDDGINKEKFIIFNKLKQEGPVFDSFNDALKFARASNLDTTRIYIGKI
jgi:hypothetical protein